jgi:tetratricopeptide (TPR) repeat protein
MDALFAGLLEEASAAITASYEELLDLLGEDHPEVGHVRVSRGMVALASGNLSAAQEDLEAGLSVLDAWEEEAAIPFRLRARVAYGDLLRQQGAYERAVQILREAQEEARNLDPSDPQVAITANALGIALRFVGLYEEALSTYQIALSQQQLHAPDDRSGRATLLHNLAGLAHGRGDVLAAEAHIREALSLRSGGIGETLDRGLLAAILDEAGRSEEALSAFEETRSALSVVFPPHHPEHAYAAHNHGDALSAAGRLEEAEVAYREAILGKQRSLGPSHPETALSRSRRASVLARLGRPEAAEEALEALAMVQDALPSSHPFRQTIEAIASEIGVLHPDLVL